jgi:hypothetical protein
VHDEVEVEQEEADAGAGALTPTNGKTAAGQTKKLRRGRW